MNTDLQHKDILFLASLSPDIIVELEKKKIDYSYFLNKIKSFANVDFRETISKEDLSSANQYKIVIVVGHRKGDALELSDLSLFPMTDIVTSLPPDFSGVIDVSVCNSTVIHDAIKKRCPNALVQTANEKTGIDFRLPLYSILLNHLPANINYRDAYILLLKRMEAKQSLIPKQELDNRPTTTKLGTEPVSLEQKRVSISSPDYVILGYTFPVQVFLHYDSEKETIEAIAKWHDHDTKSPLQLGTLKAIHKGDKIDIKISMMDVNKQPTNLITVCDHKCSYTKSIILCDERTDEVFDVCVTENYNYYECWAIIEIMKSGNGLIKPFSFKITIRTIYSHFDNNSETQHDENEGHKNEENWRTKKPRIRTYAYAHENAIVQAMRKVLEDNLILKKQDWAAIWQIMHERDISYPRTYFVKLLKSNYFKKFDYLIPESSSSIDKLLTNLIPSSKFPEWRFSDNSMKYEEIERLKNLADIFIKYFQDNKE